MTNVLIGPVDWGRSPVVASNVTQELACEVLHRGEDPARNYVALVLENQISTWLSQLE